MKQFQFNLLLYLFFTFSVYAHKQPFTLMLNPFGDAGNAGRIIDGCYERGLTLQCTEQLKEAFKQKLPQIEVILTRFQAEHLEPLQNAYIANRLKTNLYITLQFYFQKYDSSHVMLYYYIQHPTDLWVEAKPQSMSYIPADQAYRVNHKQTQKAATLCAQELNAIANSYNFIFQGIYSFPCKSLLGIQAPALTLEIGLKSKNDWPRFVEPLAICIEKLITNMQTENV